MIKKLLASTILLLIFPILGQSKTVLVPYQYLKTSGARDITPFHSIVLNTLLYLSCQKMSRVFLPISTAAMPKLMSSFLSGLMGSSIYIKKSRGMVMKA